MTVAEIFVLREASAVRDVIPRAPAFRPPSAWTMLRLLRIQSERGAAIVFGSINGPASGGRRRRMVLWGLATALVLLLPLGAMQLTDEVAWTAFDFAVAGGLLLGAGAAYELFARRDEAPAYRAGAAVALGTALSLVWAAGAVGVIGDETNPANLLFAAVPAIAAAGAAMARLRPAGLARAMTATAAAQALAGLAAPVAGRAGPEGTADALLATALFTGLWLLSARLFARAAGTER